MLKGGDNLDRSALERIDSVLWVFFTDPTYKPRDFNLIQSELNPTKDRIKSRVLRLDAIVDWRMRIYSCFRCNLLPHEDCNQMAWWHTRHVAMSHMCHRIWPHERREWRRYLNRYECMAWWRYYWQQVEGPDMWRAVHKIYRNFDRWGVEIGE